MIRTHKYGAKAQEIDGHKFRSKLEVSFYKFFKDNNIEILEYEPKFLLQDKFECRGVKYRPIEYKADFTINYEGDIFIVEAKGLETPEFKLKLKIWMNKYGHENNYILAKSLKQLKEQLGLI